MVEIELPRRRTQKTGSCPILQFCPSIFLEVGEENEENPLPLNRKQSVTEPKGTGFFSL